jgi:hypothetical protein
MRLAGHVASKDQTKFLRNNVEIKSQRIDHLGEDASREVVLTEIGHEVES